MKLKNTLTTLVAFLFFPIASCFSSSYQPYKASHDMVAALKEFGAKYAKNHIIRFLLAANPTNSKEVFYQLLMNSSEKVTVDEGREIAIDLFIEFITALRTDKRIAAYLAYIDKDPWRALGKDVRSINAIGFRIDFWDKNVDRIMPPHLAQIMFEDGYFYYYEADPKTLDLQLVCKESYQEALKKSGHSFEITPTSIFDVKKPSE